MKRNTVGGGDGEQKSREERMEEEWRNKQEGRESSKEGKKTSWARKD